MASPLNVEKNNYPAKLTNLLIPTIQQKNISIRQQALVLPLVGSRLKPINLNYRRMGAIGHVISKQSSAYEEALRG